MFDVDYPNCKELADEGKKAVQYVKAKVEIVGARLHDFCSLSARTPPRGL